MTVQRHEVTPVRARRSSRRDEILQIAVELFVAHGYHGVSMDDIGAAVGVYLKVSGGLREGRYVPFGPFLAGGGLTVLLIGPRTVMAWLGLPG